jgi:hypothetical protein
LGAISVSRRTDRADAECGSRGWRIGSHAVDWGVRDHHSRDLHAPVRLAWPFADWRTYENAAVRLLSGEAIYAPEQLSGPYHLTDVLLVGYAYPPASVPLMIPFQGYPLGLAAWIIVNLGALLTALWAVVSRAWPTYRLLVFAFVLVGLAFYLPFKEGILPMTTNIGLAGAVGWVSIGLTPRQAGTIGGVLTIVKVFAGALSLGTAGPKLPAIGSAVVVAGLLVVASLPMVGLDSWFDFGTALTTAVPDCAGANYSIACTLGPSLGFQFASMLGVLVGGTAAMAMLACRQAFLLSVLAAVAIMAPANNLHIHFWIITYVLGVVCLARITVLRRAARVVAA